MYLRSYNFTVEHVAGKLNQLPDALSREPGDTVYVEDGDEFQALLPPERSAPASSLHIAFTRAEDLRTQINRAQIDEPIDYKDAERFLQPGQHIQRVNDAYYILEHGQPPRLYVPYKCRKDVIAFFHEDPLAGHPGAEETLRAIRERHFWPRMRNEIRRQIYSCPTCQLVKAAKPLAKGACRPREPYAPWDTVSLDLMGPYPRTARGKRFILVATDTMSRWIEAFPVSNSETSTIAPILEQQVFMRWGYARVLITDNAPQFRRQAWQKRCHDWGVRAYTTPAYWHQANPTERRNQDIKRGLRLNLHGRRQREWDI